MKPYIQILTEEAERHGITLLMAFKTAEIPTSTYYRTINGDTELRHETAERVMKAIEKIHALQQARQYTEELRSAGKKPHMRSIRARFKSRITG